VYKAPRGTNDILPQDQPLWTHVDALTASLCERFGYRRIDTPVFEESGLFVRSVGAATDVVEKETYTFNDRSGDSMTLRPEATAGVCRAYLEHGMRVLPQPVRFYSVRAPMFRYDRPQAGASASSTRSTWRPLARRMRPLTPS
jgi:histidyl-tRNA synthetase